MNLEYKGLSGTIVKDIDQKEGIVTGYFSAFGNVDSDGDMIMPGAFLKTISENGPEAKNRILHLWQHMPTEPIGKPSVLKEDHYGLYFETKLSKTSRGIDALKLYEDGIINEHSIGFNTVKKEQKSNYTAIHEVKLWEGSSVTWGANYATPSTGIKSFGADAITYIETQKANIYKAIRNGTYTDDTFQLLFDQLEYLDNQLKSLLTTTPDITQAATALEPVEEKAAIDESEVRSVIHVTGLKFYKNVRSNN